MSGTDQLPLFFEKHLRVSAIAEKILLFSLESYPQEMAHHSFETVAIKTKNGILKYDKGDPFPSPISPADIRPASLPLFEAFGELVRKRRLFIGSPSRVTHIVTRSDLDKIPVRLGLFGVISVFETHLKDLLRNSLPHWKDSLSKQRLEAAQRLYELKVSRSEEIDLIQCLQFVDLGAVFSKKRRYKTFSASLSRQDYDDMLRNIGKLRDALAHSQPVLPFSWEEVEKMLSFMRKILEESRGRTKR